MEGLERELVLAKQVLSQLSYTCQLARAGRPWRRAPKARRMQKKIEAFAAGKRGKFSASLAQNRIHKDEGNHASY